MNRTAFLLAALLSACSVSSKDHVTSGPGKANRSGSRPNLQHVLMAEEFIYPSARQRVVELFGIIFPYSDVCTDKDIEVSRQTAEYCFAARELLATDTQGVVELVDYLWSGPIFEPVDRKRASLVNHAIRFLFYNGWESGRQEVATFLELSRNSANMLSERYRQCPLNGCSDLADLINWHEANQVRVIKAYADIKDPSLIEYVLARIEAGEALPEREFIGYLYRVTSWELGGLEVVRRLRAVCARTPKKMEFDYRRYVLCDVWLDCVDSPEQCPYPPVKKPEHFR